MAVVPLFRDEVAAELARLAAATDGAAALVTPTSDLALVHGDLTVEAAHLARVNASSAPGWLGESASFSCDDATWLHVIRVTGGWVLALQSRGGRDDGSIREALRRSRNALTILLAQDQPA
jgi:hypothetical protein